MPASSEDSSSSGRGVARSCIRGAPVGSSGAPSRRRGATHRAVGAWLPHRHDARSRRSVGSASEAAAVSRRRPASSTCRSARTSTDPCGRPRRVGRVLGGRRDGPRPAGRAAGAARGVRPRKRGTPRAGGGGRGALAEAPRGEGEGRNVDRVTPEVAGARTARCLRARSRAPLAAYRCAPSRRT
jgi:hypothetical protein